MYGQQRKVKRKTLWHRLDENKMIYATELKGSKHDKERAAGSRAVTEKETEPGTY